MHAPAPLLHSVGHRIRDDHRAQLKGDVAFWSVPELRERGWTVTMIRRLLGETDRLLPNPNYRSAARMRLYRQERVLATEREAAFTEWAAKAAIRSARGKEVAERRAQELLTLVEAMTVSVSQLEPGLLQERAIAHYNRRSRNGPDDRLLEHESASPGSSRAFLQRITVNYARHQLTGYDRNLERVAGQVGVAQAVTAIRRRIYAAIAGAYPHLAAECERQFVVRLDPGKPGRDG